MAVYFGISNVIRLVLNPIIGPSVGIGRLLAIE